MAGKAVGATVTKTADNPRLILPFREARIARIWRKNGIKRGAWCRF